MTLVRLFSPSPNCLRHGAMLLLLLGLVGAFGSTRGQVSTTQYDVTEQADGPQSIALADVDGDGHTDILAALKAEDAIVWYRNLPDAAFGQRRTLSASVPGPAAVEAGDIDGDGDADVVVTSYEGDYVAWFENRGTSAPTRFSAQQRIGTTLSGAIDLALTDFDSDGDPDVLAAAFLGDRVVWYENRFERSGSFASAVVISDAPMGPRELTAAPITDDDAPDVLVASQKDSTFSWFKGGTFGGRRVLLRSNGGAQSIDTGDLDGNGTVDAVGIHDDAVVWFSNQGGTFADAEDIAEVDQGKHVHTADLDEDGDLDILTASGGDDTFAWIENRLDETGSFAPLVPITTEADGALDVTAGDLNGDAFADVVGAAWWDDRIAAFFNDGIGRPPSPRALTASEEREEAARITWSATSPPDAAGYRLYRAKSAFDTPSAATAVGPSPLSDTSYTDTGLDASRTYHYRVLAVDETGTQSVLSPADTVTPDPPEPVAPKQVSLQLRGRQVTLQWAANPEADLDGYRVYRARSSSAPVRASVLVSDGLVRQPSFTDTLRTGGTIYYRIQAVDEEGNRGPASSAVSTFFYPDRLAVNAERTFDDDYDADGYRLVALPGAIQRPLAPTVTGRPETDWIALWDSGASEDPFVRFDDSDFTAVSDTFTFRPGRGFWLLGDAPWRVRDTVDTVPLRDSSGIKIDLHDGWNIISNPLDKAVRWRLVDAAHEDTLQALWRFRGAFEQTSLFGSARTGEAYYFLNRQNLDSLRIPYPGAPASNAKSGSGTSPSSPALRLHVHRNGARRSTARIRLHRAARSGLDPYDQFAPTAPGESVRLRLSPPTTASTPRRGTLAEEARPPDGAGERFALTLTSPPNTPVRLQVRGLDTLPWREAVLVNEATGRRHDLRATSSVALTPSTETTSFALLVGTDAFVETPASTTSSFALHAPTPNPFRAQTRVRYTLPEAAHVHMTVYDVLGRRVATLLDTRKGAGPHTTVWEGRNGSGTGVASGVYFLRLRAGGERAVRKIVRMQ